MTVSVSEFKANLVKGVARPNLYRIDLPSIDGIESPRELNLMCSAVNLPGKQIMTSERSIGMKYEKIAYSYAVDDIALTFIVRQDLGVKRYFEAWAARAINFDTLEVRYKQDYVEDVEIHQLNSRQEIVYTCKLEDAFPTTLNAISLSNDAAGLMEFNVQLSYTDWKSTYR